MVHICHGSNLVVLFLITCDLQNKRLQYYYNEVQVLQDWSAVGVIILSDMSAVMQSRTNFCSLSYFLHFRRKKLLNAREYFVPCAAEREV